MMKPKQIIKHIAQRALELEYGFAPALSTITIHKSSPAGCYWNRDGEYRIAE